MLLELRLDVYVSGLVAWRKRPLSEQENECFQNVGIHEDISIIICPHPKRIQRDYVPCARRTQSLRWIRTNGAPPVSYTHLLGRE